MPGRRHSRTILITILLAIVEISLSGELRRLHAQNRPAAPIDYERLVRDLRMMSELAEMVAYAESTPQEDEIAAFLVRDAIGRYSIIRWPVSGRERTESWRGPIPRGTVAVVHTHPNGWSKPSASDHRESTRSGLPFLVLTRWDIWVAEPDQRRAQPVIRTRNWTAPSHLASLEPEEQYEELPLTAGATLADSGSPETEKVATAARARKR